MLRPPYETFQRATCRGSIILNSACGLCERCAWERAALDQALKADNWNEYAAQQAEAMGHGKEKP